MSLSATHKLKQARERLEQGDITGAAYLCEQVLGRTPLNAEASCLLGIIHLMSGAVQDAVIMLQRAVSALPEYGLALEHLGLAHLLLGEAAAAEAPLRAATALRGAPASVHMRLGLSLLYQGRVNDAISALRRAVSLAPDDTDCQLNLGQALARAGDLAAARSALEAAMRLDPARTDAMFNLGVIEMEQDNADTAEQWFTRVTAKDPQHADALVNLGIVAQKRQHLNVAIDFFQRALKLNPALAAARNNLAHTLVLQNRFAAAREEYLVTLSAAPELIEAHEGLATVCRRLGRLKECIEHLQQIIALGSGNGLIWAGLADALFQSGEITEAEAAATRASEIDGDAIGPYSVRALVHIVRKEPGRAIDVLEAGFRRTGAGGLLGMLTHQLQRTCDWARWRDAWREMSTRIDHDADLGSPFWLLTAPTTAEQQVDYTRRWAHAQFGTGVAAPTHAEEPLPNRRLRIGYLSSDLHDHATAHLFTGVLERHDHTRFEVFAYSYGPEDGSALRQRIKDACEHFADVAWEPDDVVVQRIRDDALDVLVDLKGYTLGARTAILAQRPCRVQVNWLGYPGTMGASFVDYLIADAFIVPPGRETAYSEQIAFLSPCWQCNDQSRPVIAPLSRQEYGLPDDAFVYCCFNQAVKITPEVFACWMSLLHNAPHTVLWLADDSAEATRNLTAAAIAQGIAQERLIFAPRLPLPQHLARYQAADLALDTYPYTSHTTASDALWLGCPLIALCGDTFPSRVSGSILSACGLPELITYTLQEYQQLAARFANDPEFSQATRARWAAMRISAPLFDATTTARNLEAVYLDLVSNAQRQT